MTKLPKIDSSYLNELLLDLLNIPSPTGYTDPIINYLEDKLKAFPKLDLNRSVKGTLAASWAGDSDTIPRGITVHVDTLGAMVKEIKSNGRLSLSQLGGYAWNTIEGEGCTVLSSGGGPIRGSILLNKASSHAFGQEVGTEKR